MVFFLVVEEEKIAIENMVEMFKIRLEFASTVEATDICIALAGLSEEDINKLNRELPELD